MADLLAMMVVGTDLICVCVFSSNMNLLEWPVRTVATRLSLLGIWIKEAMQGSQVDEPEFEGPRNVDGCRRKPACGYWG